MESPPDRRKRSKPTWKFRPFAIYRTALCICAAPISRENRQEKFGMQKSEPEEEKNVGKEKVRVLIPRVELLPV